MFCTKCGNKLEGDEAFCTKCGGRVIESAPVESQPTVNVKKKKSAIKIVIPIVSVVLACVIVVVTCFIVRDNSGYRKILKSYVSAIENDDAELLASVYAQYWIDYSDMGFGKQHRKRRLEEIVEEDYSVEYKILSEKRATSEDCRDIENAIDDEYVFWLHEGHEYIITDAYLVDIYFTFSGVEGVEEGDTSILFIEENGVWRMARGSLNCDFCDD